MGEDKRKVNRTEMARAWLEEKRPGAFGEVVRFCVERGGEVHAGADVFLAGYPCEDDERCLHIVFQCSKLGALRDLLEVLPYDRVRWRRDFGHGGEYGERERAIADFRRHKTFGVKE